MNIIFLDIDGVLNDEEFFSDYKLRMNLLNSKYSTYERLNDLNYLFECQKLKLDLAKIFLLKELVTMTNFKVVLISAWINTKTIPLVEDYLNSLGIKGMVSKLHRLNFSS